MVPTATPEEEVDQADSSGCVLHPCKRLSPPQSFGQGENEAPIFTVS